MIGLAIAILVTICIVPALTVWFLLSNAQDEDESEDWEAL